MISEENHWGSFLDTEPFFFSKKVGNHYKETALSAKEVIDSLSPLITEQRYNTLVRVIEARVKSFVPIMENLYDRGNVSAVMRSAESFGFYKMHIVEPKNQRFKSANRVTQGADKWLQVRRYSCIEQSIGTLKDSGYQVFATHLSPDSLSIDQVDFSKPTAFIFGNEKEGVSAKALKLVDAKVIIPMQGFSQSFNISVAAALCFYHVHLYKKNEGQGGGDLSVKEKEILLANYLLKSVKNPTTCLLEKK